jgi:hypothetical protein
MKKVFVPKMNFHWDNLKRAYQSSFLANYQNSYELFKNVNVIIKQKEDSIGDIHLHIDYIIVALWATFHDWESFLKM